jgi:ATP-dependent RNA helicase DeaD
VEQQGRITEHDEREAASVGRSQNAVHILPHDMTSAAAVLGPVLDRLDRGVTALQLLIVAPDPDAAIALARAASSVPQAAGLRIIPASSGRRATRLLRARPAQGVIGAPTEILELVRTSVLKLEHVRVLVLAWVDEIVNDAASRESLEAVLAEIPKDAARSIIASRHTADLEQLIERYARRARRSGDIATNPTPTPIRYVSASAWGRLPTLQRVLDELDPEVAAVFTRSDATERELRELLESLGHTGDDAGVRITRGGPVIEADTLVLLDIPSRDELRAVMAGATPTVVAIIQPRQLETIRALAGGAAVTPLHTSTAPLRARKRVAALRSQLREVLASGIPAHELLALEPLLEEYDGVEIAAAALRLLERERERTREVRAASTSAVAAAAPASSGWTRIFVGAGTRDRIGPGDLVGAITGEAGVTRESIGKIELRENHSLVEIASGDAERVASALTGTMLRGRRVVARVDQGRDSARGERGTRGFRGDRGRRSERGREDRGDRGPRRTHGDVERRRPPASDAG